MKTLFLTLRTFSATGGIEKVCRIMGKALYEDMLVTEGTLQICSMYDKSKDAWDNLYFPVEIFRGFGVNKLFFIEEMVREGSSSTVVILSHINLLPVGWLIKKVAPGIKLILLAHGIEIWYSLSARRTNMLRNCNKIFAVSAFTKNKIIETHNISADKISVLNNCLDPFLPLPTLPVKNEVLLKKYGFEVSDKILMTLTRLSSKERYKGYDKVLQAMSALKNVYPNLKYLIAGNYDMDEKAFADSLIMELGLKDCVVLPGFIADEELEDHFAMSSMYIMPSRKEGFGIVFIEAMYYGLPVIAGNIDGSTDALLDGRLGQLVNPDDVDEIEIAIQNIITHKKAFTPNRGLLMQHFNYDVYKEKLTTLISAGDQATNGN